MHESELFDGPGRASELARRDHLAAIVESSEDAIVGETLDGAPTLHFAGRQDVVFWLNQPV